jgi:hypothetical protein
MTTADDWAMGLINFIRHIMWHGEPTSIDVDLNELRWEKERKMAKTLSVGSDYVGKMRALIPIRLRDPVSDDVHAPGDPTATSSDPNVAEATVYNLMLAIRFTGVGKCQVTLEDKLPSGKTLKMSSPVDVEVTQDPQPTEIDVDTEEVTWEPESTPHP